MKKILLGAFLLSSLSMAEGKLFDFKNADPFEGKLKSGSIIEKRFGNLVTNNNTILRNKLDIDTKFFDFVELNAKLARDVNAKSINKFETIQNKDLKSVGLALDFKQYGKPSFNLLYEYDKGYEINGLIRYSNVVNVHGLNIETDTRFKLSRNFPLSTKLGFSYDVLDGLNVYTSGILGLEVIGTKEEPIRVGGQYTLGVKVDKYHIENNTEFKYGNNGSDTKLDNIEGEGSYNNLASDVLFENKFAYRLDKDILKVDGLVVRPKLDAALDLDIFTLKHPLDPGKLTNLYGYVKPGLSVDYQVAKNIGIKAGTGVTVTFLDNAPKESSNKLFVQAIPNFELGLEYSF